MTDFGRRVAAAAANILPKTGQLTSYADYDDGYYQKGWEGERFTDNGDNTTTDNATGLMWIKDTVVAGVGGPYGWVAAIAACEELEYAGHSDWRLPNIMELYSIVNCEAWEPALYEEFFVWADKDVWSSTVYLSGADTFFVMDYGRGRAGYDDLEYSTDVIRPVRTV